MVYPHKLIHHYPYPDKYMVPYGHLYRDMVYADINADVVTLEHSHDYAHLDRYIYIDSHDYCYTQLDGHMEYFHQYSNDDIFHNTHHYLYGNLVFPDTHADRFPDRH